MLNEYKAVDASAIRNGYYQYYYEDKGKLIGIVDTKKKAFLMADTLFRKRKQWIDEQRQAVNNIYNDMNIGTVDGLDELPFG